MKRLEHQLPIQAKERFFAKTKPINQNGCIEWTACTDKGYGVFYMNGTNILAHRFAYKLFHGQLSKTDCVLHKCDNPICINHEHLFLGSRDDNNKDRNNKGRQFHARGELQGAHKLKEFQVLDIRKRIALGERNMDLALEYKVSRDMISLIKHKKRWKHI